MQPPSSGPTGFELRYVAAQVPPTRAVYHQHCLEGAADGFVCPICECSFVSFSRYRCQPSCACTALKKRSEHILLLSAVWYDENSDAFVLDWLSAELTVVTGATNCNRQTAPLADVRTHAVSNATDRPKCILCTSKDVRCRSFNSCKPVLPNGRGVSSCELIPRCATPGGTCRGSR